MATLDWSQCPAVESIPGKVSGAWLFKGTRTPVSIVFENLQDGMTIDELMEQYPLTREQITAALAFAASSLETSPAMALYPLPFGKTGLESLGLVLWPSRHSYFPAQESPFGGTTARSRSRLGYKSHAVNSTFL